MTVPNQFLHKHQGSGARPCEVPRIGQVGGEPRREAGADGQEQACVRDRLEPRLHVGDGGFDRGERRETPSHVSLAEKWRPSVDETDNYVSAGTL